MVIADKVNPEPVERPLRHMTMQGPRVTVVRSDSVSSGEWVWRVRVLKDSKVTPKVLEAIAEYLQVQGSRPMA